MSVYENGVKTHQKVACVDFDGVIASYDGWKGPEHFGQPIPYAREALYELFTWGWRIVIFTTRLPTQGMLDYLKFHDIHYDAINATDHNPSNTSDKPIADVYFDDRSWWDARRKWCWRRVMKRMRRLYQPPRDTNIDDASIWGGWIERMKSWLWNSPDSMCP